VHSPPHPPPGHCSLTIGPRSRSAPSCSSSRLLAVSSNRRTCKYSMPSSACSLSVAPWLSIYTSNPLNTPMCACGCLLFPFSVQRSISPPDWRLCVMNRGSAPFAASSPPRAAVALFFSSGSKRRSFGSPSLAWFSPWLCPRPRARCVITPCLARPSSHRPRRIHRAHR